MSDWLNKQVGREKIRYGGIILTRSRVYSQWLYLLLLTGGNHKKFSWDSSWRILLSAYCIISCNFSSVSTSNLLDTTHRKYFLRTRTLNVAKLSLALKAGARTSAVHLPSTLLDLFQLCPN